jgi:hypothetical protein
MHTDHRFAPQRDFGSLNPYPQSLICELITGPHRRETSGALPTWLCRLTGGGVSACTRSNRL